MARRAAETLQQMRDAERLQVDGFETFAEECIRASSQVKSLQWEQIRRERFNITPEGLFKELVANAESLISRRAAEERRRLEWLREAEALHDHVDVEDVPVAPSRGDKYGCDPTASSSQLVGKPRSRRRTWFARKS